MNEETVSQEEPPLALLSRNSYSILYKGALRSSQHQIVMKIWSTVHAESKEVYSRIKKEVSVLQQLRHPHIIPLLKMMRTNQGLVLISEYAPYGSLQEHLSSQKQQPLPAQQALSIIQQVGKALHAAHERGIVHGNITPNNILFLTKDLVALTDFYIPGIYTALSGYTDSEENVLLRRYMAPEQFQGIRSAKTDQYALGCLAYELLAGRPPFIGSARTTLQLKHTSEQPKSLRAVKPAIPHSIDHAILQALAKNPVERHHDIQAFLSALNERQANTVFLPRNSPLESAPTIPPEEHTQFQQKQEEHKEQKLRRAAIPVTLAVLAILLICVLLLQNPALLSIKGSNALDVESTSPTALVQKSDQTTPTGVSPTTPQLSTSTPQPADQSNTQTPNSQSTMPIAPAGTLKPMFECVQRGSNSYIVRFGYTNSNTNAVSLPVGNRNQINPSSYASALPTAFLPGNQSAVLQLSASNGTTIAWNLDGTTASTSGKGKPC